MTPATQPDRTPDLTGRKPDLAGRRFVLGAMALAVVITVAYWTLWYADRSSVASNHRAAYYEFENAFPLADGWLVLTLLLSIVLLVRGAAAALLWLIAAGASAMYLLGMDVLYDIEQRVWWRSGAGGWIELIINVLTLALGVLLLVWTWLRREALLHAADPD
jgi:hypothetical protein